VEKKEEKEQKNQRAIRRLNCGERVDGKKAANLLKAFVLHTYTQLAQWTIVTKSPRLAFANGRILS